MEALESGTEDTENRQPEYNYVVKFCDYLNCPDPKKGFDTLGELLEHVQKFHHVGGHFDEKEYPFPCTIGNCRLR